MMGIFLKIGRYEIFILVSFIEKYVLIEYNVSEQIFGLNPSYKMKNTEYYLMRLSSTCFEGAYIRGYAFYIVNQCITH